MRAAVHTFPLRQALRPWLGSIALAPLCAYFALRHGEYTLLDHADLIIHEAGHFFFRFFGDFLYMFGGTLMQMLLPGLLVWNFVLNDYTLGAQLSLFWLGHNLLNISVYAADAQARALPLLGGASAIHDWWSLLGRLGLLHWDAGIGMCFYASALFVFGCCLAAPRLMNA